MRAWILRLLFVFGALSFTPGCARREAQREAQPNGYVDTGFIHKTHGDSDGTRSKYVVFVPPNYDAKNAWPAILFLHGLGQSGTDGVAQVERGLGAAIRSRKQSFPFITIFPRSRARSWLADSNDGRRALAILDEVQQQYSVDPQRIYLTGYSMGGEGTWSLAARHNDRFAAIVPTCPGSDLTIVSQLAHIPCWCFQGDADHKTTVHRTRSMVLALQRAGGQPLYQEYPGVGHNCWDLTYADPAVFEWLLTHRRVRASD